LPGYVKLDAWPGPDPAAVHITYDPAKTNEATIRQAITEPYFELEGAFFRASPFEIVK
jgi:hypothetical protein